MKCKHLKSDKITQKVEKFNNKYAINGCCGGGCFIITEITHCPFCGEKVIE